MALSAPCFEEISWQTLQTLLLPGDKVDIQFSQTHPPEEYKIIMTLDEPVIICKAANIINIPSLEIGATAFIFIPSSANSSNNMSFNNMCLVKSQVIQVVENGRYLALRPVKKASLLRHIRSFRVKASNDIGYRIQFEGKSSIYKGITVQDISKDGIGLIVYASGLISKNTIAKIDIKLPEVKELIHVQARVKSCVQYGSGNRTFRIGLQFKNLSSRDKELIAAYMDRVKDSSVV